MSYSDRASISSGSESTDEGLDRSFTESVSSTTGGKKTKIFHDMVHPHLELPILCYKIINTPQFQRLRNLKQLGLCYHVYPSACHNRFEHCIGTSYLAGKYCKILQKNQHDLHIDDKDILCLYIAGLCHDLGHGPFSHTWEAFMKRQKQNFSHEEMSIRMLDYMIKDNALWELFKEENLDDRDLVFVKELIIGRPLDGTDSFQGRLPSKHFLYQIVCNDDSKIDVDKFDYLHRDSKQLNVTMAFDYTRIIENTRVFGVETDTDGTLKTDKDGNVITVASLSPTTSTLIAYRKKISENLEELFSGRFSLHQKAYQHRVTKIIEEMVLDGLMAAEPDFEVTGGDGKVYKLSTAHEDVSAFMKLTDSVFEMIHHWGNGNPKASRIFDSILRRDLYKCIGYISKSISQDIEDELLKVNPNIFIIKTNINYGKNTENPLDSAFFYEKGKPNVLSQRKFSPPKTETKCFIVSRFSWDDSEYLPGSKFASELKHQEITHLVKVWAKRKQITIETE